MPVYTDISSNNLYILINYYAVKDPWSDPDPQVNGFCLSYNVSFNYNDDDSMPSLFYPDNFPYKDKITDVNIIYEREFLQKSFGIINNRIMYPILRIWLV